MLSVPFPKLRVNGTHKLQPVLRLYVSLPGVLIIYLSLLAKTSFKANYSAIPCSADPAIPSHQVQTGQADGFVRKVCLYLCLSPLICLSLCPLVCVSVFFFLSASRFHLEGSRILSECVSVSISHIHVWGFFVCLCWSHQTCENKTLIQNGKRVPFLLPCEAAHLFWNPPPLLLKLNKVVTSLLV